ncbi:MULTISPECIES: hypothetical protein [Pseudomonas]|uniref:Uncharacterized protein n=1 Tax=Pseudomonas quercus TaxID=2722792 RepID=A0ABX0YBR4_9PSED|nr:MULTISPECIES: hypothetical protein [Pseudomonas]MBF7141008.1 hypothetical protein [Pseudomonas sp. LY10J]NJO99542.1 hypothetical protein [Pseudomonas quercus]
MTAAAPVNLDPALSGLDWMTECPPTALNERLEQQLEDAIPQQGFALADFFPSHVPMGGRLRLPLLSSGHSHSPHTVAQEASLEAQASKTEAAAILRPVGTRATREASAGTLGLPLAHTNHAVAVPAPSTLSEAVALTMPLRATREPLAKAERSIPPIGSSVDAMTAAMAQANAQGPETLDKSVEERARKLSEPMLRGLPENVVVRSTVAVSASEAGARTSTPRNPMLAGQPSALLAPATAGNRPYLQVPFDNGAVTGELTISKPGPNAPFAFVIDTQPRVAEQLRQHWPSAEAPWVMRDGEGGNRQGHSHQGSQEDNHPHGGHLWDEQEAPA